MTVLRKTGCVLTPSTTSAEMSSLVSLVSNRFHAVVWVRFLEEFVSVVEHMWVCVSINSARLRVSQYVIASAE
jgi:hypothetical protein